MRTVSTWLLAGLALLTLSLTTPVASAHDGHAIIGEQLGTSVDFPNAITFTLQGLTTVPVERAAVEYTVRQRTCASSIASGIVPITSPAQNIDLSWTLDLRERGGLPVGARLTYRWVLTTAAGDTFVSSTKPLLYEDPRFAWRTIEGEHTVLQWYSGDDAFARELLTAADDGMQRLTETAGITPGERVHVRIYRDAEAMRETILFSQEWVGGAAFPEYGLVTLGVSEGNLPWGKQAMVHEMAHVVIDETTFTCGTSIPTWLNEGLATYNEGPIDPVFVAAMDNAIAKDSAYSVRGLAAPFSSSREAAVLSYAQSRSLVAYLIEELGAQAMRDLLTTFQTGGSIDQAMLAVYGFDQDGLEDRWRESLSLSPRAPQTGLTPEPIPTIPPLGGLPQSQSTPTPVPADATTAPTATPGLAAEPQPGGSGCGRSGTGTASLPGGLAMLALAAAGIVTVRKRN